MHNFYPVIFFVFVFFKTYSQSTCSSPAGAIVQFPDTPNCYTVSPGDTVDECFTFTAPGNILIFTSVPAGMCTSLQVSAVLYDSACNLVQASAFGVVFVSAGSSYVWCLHYVCSGSHDTTFCPVYYDFSAIPVEWMDVDGVYCVNGDYSRITWATASELNNRQFDVEHGDSSGKKFSTVGSVPGNGTSNLVHNYKFSHAHPYYGINLYRVKQVDTNGKFSYSKTIAVIKPVHAPGVWDVFDITGRMVGTLPENNLRKLKPGFYILRNNGGVRKLVR